MEQSPCKGCLKNLLKGGASIGLPQNYIKQIPAKGTHFLETVNQERRATPSLFSKNYLQILTQHQNH